MSEGERKDPLDRALRIHEYISLLQKQERFVSAKMESLRDKDPQQYEKFHDLKGRLVDQMTLILDILEGKKQVSDAEFEELVNAKFEVDL